MRALALDPARRYATADGLRSALDQFASRAGITASTSAVAAFMRRQFGERPEPWLALGGGERDLGRAIAVFAWRSADGPVERDAALWRCHGRERCDFRRVLLPWRGELTPPPVVPPTDSKMAWESQNRGSTGRARTAPTTLAMFCALVMILGIAIWRLTATRDPAAAVQAPSLPPAFAGRGGATAGDPPGRAASTGCERTPCAGDRGQAAGTGCGCCSGCARRRDIQAGRHHREGHRGGLCALRCRSSDALLQRLHRAAIRR